MMRSKLETLLQLGNVTWVATNKDGSTIKDGIKQYDKINRKDIEKFSLQYNEKIVYSIETKQKTLAVRLRTQQAVSNNVIIGRYWVIALLQKNKDDSKNKTEKIIIGGKIDQEYSYDPQLSEIHYVTSDSVINSNQFSDQRPFDPIRLRLDEFEHLGRD